MLHDLSTETVVHIANPFSHRELGEPSLLHEIDFRPDVSLIGPYEKVNFDGRRLKSVSAVLRDQGGRAVAAIGRAHAVAGVVASVARAVTGLRQQAPSSGRRTPVLASSLC